MEKTETAELRSIADRLRQIDIEITEMRQKVVFLGVDVHSPYCQLSDASCLIMNSATKLRRIAQDDRTEQDERVLNGPAP